jgi:hypothetical protein
MWLCLCKARRPDERGVCALGRLPPTAAIAKLLLPGRSNTAVKNFWHCRLKSGSGCHTNK